MKRHAPIGADILSVIGFPYAVAPNRLGHDHRCRLDGSSVVAQHDRLGHQQHRAVQRHHDRVGNQWSDFADNRLGKPGGRDNGHGLTREPVNQGSSSTPPRYPVRRTRRGVRRMSARADCRRRRSTKEGPLVTVRGRVTSRRANGTDDGTRGDTARSRTQSSTVWRRAGQAGSGFSCPEPTPSLACGAVPNSTLETTLAQPAGGVDRPRSSTRKAAQCVLRRGRPS